MILRYFYDDQLAQASYLVGCSATGEALIIDPNRNFAQYIDRASTEGLRITAITETHIHADFVSGSRELALKTGATLYLSDEGTSEWKYAYAAEAGAHLLHDGGTFKVGKILLQAVHTPGHTSEHLSFLLTDTAGADEPMGFFSGDFIFVGDVGRPDLLERAAGITGTMQESARTLFHSLQKVRTLPDYLQIWPGHGAGSACGRALGAIPQTTMGYEIRHNWAFITTQEEQFIQDVLSGQPEPPTYFAAMKRMNKQGPEILNSLALPEPLTLEQMADHIAQSTLIIDTRPVAAFAAGYIPGTIVIPLDQDFLSRAGWLIPTDKPFMLIADRADAERAAHILQLIGLNNLAGYWSTDILQNWQKAGKHLHMLQQIQPRKLNELLEQGKADVIDVRSANDYAMGHIPGSHNIPLGYLSARHAEIPADRSVVFQCQGGTRSIIATSLIAAHGYTNLLDLAGGIDAWTADGRRIEQTGQISIKLL